MMKIKNKYSIFISIIFVIIILTLIIIIFKPSLENFNENVVFLSKEETKEFIKNDQDKYINNLSIYDLRARNVKTNDEYLNKAINSCLDFNQNQKEKLKICVKEAIKYFNNNFNWTFALVNDNYEGGFPHTRSSIIFLSPIIINYSNIELIKTLIHESIHIYQRFNKTEIQKYLDNNGFIISRKRNKNSLERSNPDLDDFIYKDKNNNELVAYYKSEYPKGINDITINSLLDEHPFEKMAYEYAEKYSKEILLKYKNI